MDVTYVYIGSINASNKYKSRGRCVKQTFRVFLSNVLASLLTSIVAQAMDRRVGLDSHQSFSEVEMCVRSNDISSNYSGRILVH